MKTKKRNHKIQNSHTPRQLRCPYCGAAVTIRSAAEIYDDPTCTKELYVCNNYPRCNTYVGMHHGTRVPYGTMANGDLRNLRIKAHRKFDQIWQIGIMNRDNAYRWLADYFCVGLGDAHIGMLGEYNCKKLIEECDLMLERHQQAS